MGCVTLLVSLHCHGQSSPTPGVPEKVLPEKVIIDTDIGDDVDDAFALALALRSPELQILGITTRSETPKPAQSLSIASLPKWAARRSRGSRYTHRE